MRTAFVLATLILVLAAPLAANPESVDQLGLGAFFPTQTMTGISTETGWSLAYTHLDKRGWYGSIQGAHYSAMAFSPSPPFGLGFTVDATALTVGAVARSRDGKGFAHAGIGIAQAEGDIGGGFTIRGDTEFAWEVGAGLIGEPLGLHVRYLDGGAPASTGVSAALTYGW